MEQGKIGINPPKFLSRSPLNLKLSSNREAGKTKVYNKIQAEGTCGQIIIDRSSCWSPL